MIIEFVARSMLALFASSCVVAVDSTGGDAETVHVVRTDIVYCDGASDCPPDPECGAFWCQQIQADDEDYGAAWGRCNLAPVVGGTSCGAGAGICDNMRCRAAK